MGPPTISPELALVDPELRAVGIALLESQARNPPVAVVVRPTIEPRPRGLAVAAGLYFASTAARVLLLDGLFVLAIAALVAALSLFA